MLKAANVLHERERKHFDTDTTECQMKPEDSQAAIRVAAKVVNSSGTALMIETSGSTGREVDKASDEYNLSAFERRSDAESLASRCYRTGLPCVTNKYLQDVVDRYRLFTDTRSTFLPRSLQAATGQSE